MLHVTARVSKYTSQSDRSAAREAAQQGGCSQVGACRSGHLVAELLERRSSDEQVGSADRPFSSRAATAPEPPPLRWAKQKPAVVGTTQLLVLNLGSAAAA